jgi:PAS domain S-box-containing protein
LNDLLQLQKNGDPDQDRRIRELLRDIERRNEETSAFPAIILRFAEVVSHRADATRVCEDFVRILIEETQFENCSIFFMNRDVNRLSLIAAFGLEDQLEELPPTPYRKGPRTLPEQSLAGRVFRSKESVFIEDAGRTPIPKLKEALVAPVSIACLPVGAVGVLNLSSNHPRIFSPESRRGWETLGNIAGYLIQRLIVPATGGERSSTAPAPRKDRLVLTKEIQHPEVNSNISDLALACMPQGVCILDSEGNVRRANHAFLRIMGGEITKIIGRSPAVLFRDPSIFRRLLGRAAESEAGPVQKIDSEIINSAGEVHLADISIVKMAANSPEPPGYLVVLDDVTGKKASFDKILRSEKLAALATLSAGVSHEFNNLLMAILGNIQLVLPRIESKELVRKLECLEKAVLDGSNTVRRLQRLTEREADLHGTGLNSDVEEAVRDVVELTRPRWKNLTERSGIEIDIELDLAAGCFAAINASDLREVLTNLLLNAVDAMPEGGTIVFRSHRRGGEIFLEVSDTGFGMSRHNAEKIFDPFFTTKGVGNSGLGLSVCWGLLVRNGAEIQVKSRKGLGTTFYLKFQAVDKVKNPPAADPKAGKIACRLLVVEDDPDILSLMRDMLRLKGHKVVAVSDGRKALKLIETDKFDMVLTDLGMPGVSGWEIAKQAKARNSKAPVVMITGWGIQYKDEELSERGVDLMLAKPLSWDKLLGAVDRML